MATLRAKAVLKADAMERIKVSAPILAKRFGGVDLSDLEGVTGRKDPQLMHAQQLSIVADFLDGLVEATELKQGSPKVSNAVAELKDELEQAVQAAAPEGV